MHGGTRAKLAQRIVLAVAILVAIVVRVLFLDNKPFWRDESWVALVVADPNIAITGARAVPVGFAWLAHLTGWVVPGPLEVSYRIVPLLAGIAIVPLMARMATALGAVRWVAVTAAWTAVGLVPLVYYSRELKSYDLDMLLAMLVPMLAITVFDRAKPGRASRAPLLGLVALLIAAPWVSFGATFAIAALLAWGWVTHLLVRPRATFAEVRDLLICSVAYTASFGAAYVLAFSAQEANPTLLAFWEPYMLGSADLPLWTRITTGVWNYVAATTTYFFADQWKLIVPFTILGALTWPRPHRWLLLWMYLVSAAFCIAAALTDHYVIGHGRHLLFALPPVLLWTAQGLWVVADPLLGPRFRPFVTLAPAMVFALIFSVLSIQKRGEPYRTNRLEFFRYDVLQDVDDGIAGVESLAAPGDAVIISERTSYAFQLYRHGRLPQAIHCERDCHDWEVRAAEWLKGIHGRAWLLLADEEARSTTEFLETTAFVGKERLILRGVRVWELLPNESPVCEAPKLAAPRVERGPAAATR
jgi:hypothetical protein